MSKKLLRSTISFAIGVLAMLAVESSASAQLLTFENEVYNNNYVQFEGNAGIDRSLGVAKRGKNNGWIRASQGWNAITSGLAGSGTGRNCNLKLWIQTVPNLSDLYVSIIDRNTGEVLREVGPLRGDAWAPNTWNEYRPWQLSKPYLVMPPNRALRVRIGFWGNGTDAWLRVDDIDWECDFAPPTVTGGSF